MGVEQLATIQRADRIIGRRLSATENAILVNAHGALVEACMQQRGWDFEVGMATPEEAGAGPDFMSNLERWTFADVARAESEGYGFRRHLEEVAAHMAELGLVESVARIPDPLTMSAEDADRFELDYFGTEEERVEILERDGSHAGLAGGGCWGQAQRAIWGEDMEREMWLRDARGTAQSDIWLPKPMTQSSGPWMPGRRVSDSRVSTSRTLIMRSTRRRPLLSQATSSRSV